MVKEIVGRKVVAARCRRCGGFVKAQQAVSKWDSKRLSSDRRDATVTTGRESNRANRGVLESRDTSAVLLLDMFRLRAVIDKSFL